MSKQKVVQLQTEKAYNQEANNRIILSFLDPNMSMNKIEVKKMFAGIGLSVKAITFTKSANKTKRVGKTLKTTLKRRPGKFYVTLDKDTKFTEENLATLNTNLTETKK